MSQCVDDGLTPCASPRRRPGQSVLLGLCGTDEPVAEIVPNTQPTFAMRSLRSRLRLAGRVSRASSKVVRRRAQRVGGRPPVARTTNQLIRDRASRFSKYSNTSADLPFGRRLCHVVVCSYAWVTRRKIDSLSRETYDVSESPESSMGTQQHQSDPRILDRRCLSRDHRSLADLLAPGMAVLDIGCGTGAITQGIAEAVGPDGVVVGVDRDPGLIERARVRAAAFANLSFQHADVRDLTLNSWEPEPPPEFITFYSTFLSWRRLNGWDNEVANRCPALFADAGLIDIRSSVQDETSIWTDDDFAERTALWTEVIDNLGPTLRSAGSCDTSILDAARRSYESWRKTDLRHHTLSMRATVGRRLVTSA